MVASQLLPVAGDAAGDGAADAGDSLEFGGVRTVQVDHGSCGVFPGFRHVVAGVVCPQRLHPWVKRVGGCQAEEGAQGRILFVCQAVNPPEVFGLSEAAALIAVAHNVLCRPLRQTQTAQRRAVRAVGVEGEGAEHRFRQGGAGQAVGVEVGIGLACGRFLLQRGAEILVCFSGDGCRLGGTLGTVFVHRHEACEGYDGQAEQQQAPLRLR